MPGVSLSHSKSTKISSKQPINLDPVLFFDEYEKTIVRKERPTVVGFTEYEDYPITTFETDNHIVLLEGCLYNVSDVKLTSLSVAKKLFDGDTEWAKEWLLNQDAEFVLVAVEKDSGDTVVLNDALARLPIYMYSDDDTVYLSRELGFVLESNDVEPDSMGIAQCLLFGYPLGDRTLYDGVAQVPPASFIQISNGELNSVQLSQIDIEEKQHADKSLEYNAANLKDLVANSVRRRAGSGTNVVSLSGGLDSRGLAACMTDNNIPYVSATYNKGPETASEVQAAEKVMDVLGGEWREFQLKEATSEHQNQLLQLKRGMNTVGMAFILEFYEQLRSDFGDKLTYFTGDGGAKFSSWTPPRTFESNTEIVEYLLADQTRLPIDLVEELSTHTRDEIEKSIHERLASYPETSPGQRFVHFLIRERSIKWGFHGEDRNRYYFWSAAPLYAYPVFEYAMGVPDSQKKQNKLYSKIISSYSDDVLDVSYANFNAPVGSLEYRLKSTLYNLASKRPTLREKLIERFIRSDSEIDEGVVKSIKENRNVVEEYPTVLLLDSFEEWTNEDTSSISTKSATYLQTILLAMRRLGKF